MSKKTNRSGLFNGHWDRVHDDDGDRRHVRIQRSEYPELYRLHRLCSWIEQDPVGAESLTKRRDHGGRATRGASFPLREHPAYTEDSLGAKRKGGITGNASRSFPRPAASLREHPAYTEANPFH